MAVGSSVLAAPFQNKLREHLREHYKKVFLFIIQTANSAGYLPHTEPAKGPDEIVEAGAERIAALMQPGRAATWTIREQKFVRDWFSAAWERAHGNGTS